MSDWPELSVEYDHETLTVLHLAAQMIGKVRVAHAPWVNHGWHVALQPNARGLAALPTAASDSRTFTLRLRNKNSGQIEEKRFVVTSDKNRYRLKLPDDMANYQMSEGR